MSSDRRANRAAEWLETDGLGGFASGRADGIRTRRYHAVLLAATRPPTGRIALVNGVEAHIDTADGRFALTSHRYVPDVTHPDGVTHLVAFSTEPWPTWTYRLPTGLEIVHELVVRHGSPVVALSWRLVGDGQAALSVRPLISGRDTHATHHENSAFRFDADVRGEMAVWEPYVGVPAVVAVSNGVYSHAPLWYRNFQYEDERDRGLDFIEDLASPGELTFDLAESRAVLVFGAGRDASPLLRRRALACWSAIEAAERERRASFANPLHRAADDYIVRRGAGKTIVAGYPWFSDWGRDTFIALRGLCIAGDRLDDARDILLEWSGHVSEGMLPNYFPEGDQPAEYNSVDASLWYVIAVHDFLAHGLVARRLLSEQRQALLDAVDAIVSGYAAGTRFGIRADTDGLLSAGAHGAQLTWMDARVDGREITPRIGKPVELQALWINALRMAGARDSRWMELAACATRSFSERFWNADGEYLFDVIDVDHVRGDNDASFRPNQILAVGGLPFALLEGERAIAVVDAVERILLTPAGLRSLSPDHADYASMCVGDMRARDGAYHQGTVWPWLIGPFVDAWVRVRGGGADVQREAQSRFLVPLLQHYSASAPGHVGEIADGAAPHTPRGCPFQAWSVGEALRVGAGVSASGTSAPL